MRKTKVPGRCHIVGCHGQLDICIDKTHTRRPDWKLSIYHCSRCKSHFQHTPIHLVGKI